jgi:hypothetical protein
MEGRGDASSTLSVLCDHALGQFDAGHTVTEVTAILGVHRSKQEAVDGLWYGRCCISADGGFWTRGASRIARPKWRG